MSQSKFYKVVVSLVLLLVMVNAGGGQLAYANPGDVICSYAASLSSPAIGDDGTLYSKGSDGLYAINPDCTLKWKYQITSPGGGYSSPVIADDGTIYLLTNDSLYAVTPGSSSATFKWQRSGIGGNANIQTTPAIGSDGTIYVINNSTGLLYAINPADGSLKWPNPYHVATNGITGNDSSPVIGCNNVIYVGSSGGGLYAIKPDGTLKWQFTELGGGARNATPVVGSDCSVYTGILKYADQNVVNNYLAAVNPDGSRKWFYEIPSSHFVYYINSISIGNDGTVYGATEEGGLYAINPDSSLKWNYPYPSSAGMLMNQVPSFVIGIDGTIYLQLYGTAGGIYAINPNGTLKWQKTIASRASNPSPVIGSDGTIYLRNGMPPSTLHAIQGDAPWTYTDYLNSMKGYADSPWPRFKQNNFNTAHRPKKPPGFVFSLPDVSSCDKSFSIPITLDNPDSQSLRGIDLTITFDSSVITPKNLPEEAATLTGGILQGNYSLYYNKDVSGQIILSIYTNGTTVNTGGIIAYLNFDVKGAVNSTTKLNFAQALVNSTQATAKAGSFTVIGCKISGNVIYYPPSTRYVPNAQIILDGTPVSPPDGNTDCGGNYMITASAGTHKESVSKSTDLGGISGLDAYDISMYMIGKKVFNCYQKIAADVNRDGIITSEDAGIIREYAVKNRSCMNNSTPCAEWVFIPYPITDCSGWPPITYPTERTGITIPPSATGQDFIGIRIGDVTGNWTPDSATCPATRSKRSRIETRENATYTLTATPGFTCKVPILLNDSSEIRSLDITVEFVSSVLTAKSVTLSGILGGKGYAMSTGLSVAGKVFASMSAGNVVTDKGEVVYITFTPSATTQTDTTLKLTQFDVNEIGVSGAFGTAVCVPQPSDCSGDNKIGLEDAVYGLQCISGLRQNCTCNADLAKVLQVLRILSGI